MKCYVQTIIALVLACHASLCLAASPRVALMPSGDAKAAAIVELMEVELAQRDDVVLLDRANVGRMLAEQKLVLEGLLSADDAFAIGQLLGCDVFGELHFQAGADGASAVGVLTAFDAATGVRLCDATLDASGNLQEISEAAGKILLEALQKRTDAVSRTNVRAVTLLSVRNVDLRPDQSHLPDALGPILERQLLRSSGITVLERKRLDLVNKEATLTEDLRERLLASSVLLDIDLSRGTKADEIGIRAVISDNPGKELAVVAFEHNAADVEGLMAAFAQRLLDVLGLPVLSPSSDMRRKESDRFFHACNRLMQRYRFEEALVAADAAVALDPGNPVKLGYRDVALESAAMDVFRANRYVEGLDMLERSMTFRLSRLDSGKRVPQRARDHLHYRWEDLIRMGLSHADKFAAKDRERLDNLLQLYQTRLYNLHGNSDLWGGTADEWMDAILKTSTEIPADLASAQSFPALVFQVSKEKKQQLLALHEKRVLDGDPRGYIDCMLIAHKMPDAFEDAGDIVQRYLDQFVDLAINDKDGTGLLMYVSTSLRGLRTTLPASVLRPAMIRLQNEADQRKVVCHSIVLYLASPFFDGNPTAFKTAAQKVISGYVPATNRYYNANFGIYSPYSMSVPTDSSGFVEWCKRNYKRYKFIVGEWDVSSLHARDEHWAKQAKLFEFTWGARRHSIIQGVAQHESLVFLAFYRRGSTPRTTVIEFDLDGGSQRVLSSIDTGIEVHRGKSHRLSVTTNALYLIGSDRFIIFPRNGDSARMLRSGVELPNANRISVIEIDETLYIACSIYGEYKTSDYSSLLYPARGTLISSDLKGDNQVILANSERRERNSPLDNTDPYLIEGLLHDADRNQLYLMLKGSRHGVWSLDLGSGKIARASQPGNATFSTPCAAVVDGVRYERGRSPTTGQEGLLYYKTKGEVPHPNLLSPFDKSAPLFLGEWAGNLVAADSYSLWLLKPHNQRP